MKNLLLISNEKIAKDFLEKATGNIYNIINTDDVDQGLKILEELADSLISVVIFRPSKVERAKELLDYMKRSNTFIFAIPALILTDKDSREVDEEYLEDPVIDVLEIGESDKVIINRITRASQFLNSTSFSEFAGMLQKLPSLIYLKDSRGKYVFCSQYWHHLEHYDDPDWTIKGKTDMEIRKDTENAKMAYESDLRLIANGKGTSYIIEVNEDGVHEFLQIIKEPLFKDDGTVRGIIALINNVTEQEDNKRKLEKLSYTDELTGAFNRTYFEEYVKNLKPEMFPISIISADCDNLKMINDRYGHMVGDEYIRMSVTLMRSVLPNNNTICRTGGDEFVVFLPGVSAESAHMYVNMLNDMEDMFSIRECKLSVSFGTSTIDYPDESVEASISLSDAEMYKAKKKKKNRRK